MDRTELAERLCEAMRLQVVTGTADADRFYHWSFRVLDGEREERDPAGAYRHHLERMRRLEADLTSRRDAGLTGEHEVEAAAFFVVEAEAWQAMAGEDEAVAELNQAKLEQARRVEAAFRGRYRDAERAVPAEEPCLWSVRLLQAERDADPSRETQHYRDHLDRLLELERITRRRPSEGPPRAADVVEFFRWEAEYWLSLITSDSRRRTRRAAFALKRLHAAQAVYGALRAGFRAGEGVSEQLYLWSLRWLRAMRDQEEEEAAADEAEGTEAETAEAAEKNRFRALEEHLERMQTLEAALRVSHEIGVALDLGALEHFVLEARDWLRQARLEADLQGT